MVEKNPTLQTCYYRPESLRIMIDKDVIEIEPSLIARFIIIKEYDNSFFPVIQISLTLDPKQYAQIVKNSTTVKIQLKVRKVITLNGSEKKSDFINKLYSIYITDDTPFVNEKEYDTDANTIGTNNENGTNPTEEGNQTYDFFLFDHDLTERSSKLINLVCENANMTDTLAVLFTEIGVKNVLMEKLDNTDTYGSIIIPPYPITKAVAYLDSVFGLYKDPHLLFFDINVLYLISRGVQTKAYRKTEARKILINIRNTSSGDGNAGGYFHDKEDKSYEMNVDATKVSVQNISSINDQVDGNGRVLMNPAKNKLVNIIPDTVQRGVPNMKYMTLKYPDNKFIKGHIEKEMEALSRVITLQIDYVDIGIFAPNKNIQVKFEDSKINKEYGATYRVSEVVMVGSKYEDDFRPTYQVVLTQ